MVDQMN